MKKKIIIILASIIGVLIIGASAYAYNVYHSVKETANEIYEPVTPSGSEKEKEKEPLNDQDNGPKPISILLMGVDERKHDSGRSDTLIVLTLNPEEKKLQMISIPRDTRTKIIGRGTIEKINHAYAWGGTKMQMDTVEHFLNINLDYYIRINMQGLVDLVDAVGGITVYNDDSWHDPGYYKKGYFYHEGKLTLNGAQALGFVRMRYLPGGDFTRNEHQREVIKAIIDKAAGFSSFTRYDEILQAISDNVKTNLTFEEIKYIAKNYKDTRQNIVTYEMKGTTDTINGTSYVLISEAEREKVHEMIPGQG